MVPSLPLRLKAPETPWLLPCCALKFASSVASSMFSISPEPNVGVGMRKTRSFVAAAKAKSGFEITEVVQPPASTRPAIV